MATYDWSIAKAVLTESEKDRLVCLHLNRRPDGTVSELITSHANLTMTDTHRSTGTRPPLSTEVRPQAA